MISMSSATPSDAKVARSFRAPLMIDLCPCGIGLDCVSSAADILWEDDGDGEIDFDVHFLSFTVSCRLVAVTFRAVGVCGDARVL